MQIQVPRLFDGQKQAYKKHLESRFFVLCCGRRWGKDYFLARVIIESILDGKRVGLWSPQYEMTLSLFRLVLSYLWPLLKIKNTNQCRADFMPVRTNTGGHFKAWHTKDNKNGRGQKYHLAVINECAFCDASFYEEIWQDTIRPTLSTQGEEGKAIFSSTPFGHNHFKKMSEFHLKNESWSYLHYPTSASPYVSDEEIEDNRRELPSEIFARNYLAQFIGSNRYQLFPASIFDNLKEIPHIDEIDRGQKVLHIGIDFCGEGEESRDFNSFCIRIGNSFIDYQKNKLSMQEHCLMCWELLQSYLDNNYFIHIIVDAVGVGNPSLQEFRQRIYDSGFEKRIYLDKFTNALKFAKHKKLYFDRSSFLLYRLANFVQSNKLNFNKNRHWDALLEESQTLEFRAEMKGQENVIRVYKKGFDKKGKSPDLIDAMKYTLDEAFEYEMAEIH